MSAVSVAHKPVSPDVWEQDGDQDPFSNYLTALTLIERLHRQLLDVVKDELDRISKSDINSVQALLLFNIAGAELTAGELRTRGHYLGSNVSYNLKKLVELGYLSHRRSSEDRRSVRVALTPAGQEIHDMVRAVFERHMTSLSAAGGVGHKDLHSMNITLCRLERFWLDQIRFRL